MFEVDQLVILHDGGAIVSGFTPLCENLGHPDASHKSTYWPKGDHLALVLVKHNPDQYYTSENLYIVYNFTDGKKCLIYSNGLRLIQSSDQI